MDMQSDDQLREVYTNALMKSLIDPLVKYSESDEIAERLEITRRLLHKGVVRIVVGSFSSPVSPDRIQALGAPALADLVIDLALSDYVDLDK